MKKNITVYDEFIRMGFSKRKEKKKEYVNSCNFDRISFLYFVLYTLIMAIKYNECNTTDTI